MEPIWSSMRRAWGVLAVSDYVWADWEDDMEPGLLAICNQTRTVCTLGALRSFVALFATVCKKTKVVQTRRESVLNNKNLVSVISGANAMFHKP